MLVYGEGEFAQPVGMFALFDIPIDAKITDALKERNPIAIKELNCVYISKNFRGLGLDNALVTEAKKIAAQLGTEIIVFDTLNPSLNHFYEKNGAKFVCESRCPKDSKDSNPTSFFRINLK